MSIELERVMQAARRGDLSAMLAELARLSVEQEEAPAAVMASVRSVLGECRDLAAVDDARELIVARLLRAGHPDAAWAVVRDYASGRVERRFTSATSAGSPRTDAVVPLTTLVEADRAYAWAPGFRDPRYAVSDSCYDISDIVDVQVRLDEIAVRGRALVLSGAARWRHLDPTPTDEVEVSFASDPVVASWVPAVRCHRSELTTGSRTGLGAGRWAGWYAELPLSSAVVRERAPLRVRMRRGRLMRVVPSVPAAGDVARSAAASSVRLGPTRYRISIGDGQVTAVALAPVPVRIVRRVVRSVSGSGRS